MPAWLPEVASEWLRSTEPEKRRDVPGPVDTPEEIAERLRIAREEAGE